MTSTTKYEHKFTLNPLEKKKLQGGGGGTSTAAAHCQGNGGWGPIQTAGTAACGA